MLKELQQSETELSQMVQNTAILQDVIEGREVAWINPNRKDCELSEQFERSDQSERGPAKEDALSMSDIEDAENRLKRFAPLIMHCFPETRDRDGLIESELIAIPRMKALINEAYGAALSGKLLLKQDSHLAIAGSVKARGGIYEVLKHTEELALEHGLILPEDTYDRLVSEENRKFFSRYTIQVGSTGNLGMSIGIMSAAIGYRAVVHMSADARQWKKDLLRKHGVTVVEYEADYSEAVQKGKQLSARDPQSCFVDDENSKTLFLGYAVAAKRLIAQLEAQEITVDAEHPLFVYIPCGVGGAPGGVSFGLKQIFKDAVHCFFAEPVQAPCMLLGMSTGLHSRISVKDIGLTGLTHADGLAVGRASGFVGLVMEPLLSGIFTIKDENLYHYMRDLLKAEDIFLEPSACAAFAGPVGMNAYEESKRYIEEQGLTGKMADAIHIVWATGGSLVPEEIRQEYKNTWL